MTRLIPDPLYDPNNLSPISSRTKLSPGITMAKFLGAYGDKNSFRYITNELGRVQIARNLTLHARAMSLINGNTDRFNDVRLIVSEGLYHREVLDFISTEMELKATGRLVYYQVIGTNGLIDLERTYDVAKYWFDHIEYDVLYLDYDQYNPDKSLTAQIGLEMPSVPPNYEIKYNPGAGFGEKTSVATFFNGQQQASGSLVEITNNNLTDGITVSEPIIQQ